MASLWEIHKSALVNRQFGGYFRDVSSLIAGTLKLDWRWPSTSVRTSDRRCTVR